MMPDAVPSEKVTSLPAPGPDVLRARSTLIEAIKTPLGFFGLVLLILETLLIILSFRAEGADLSRLITGILVCFCAVIAIGVYLTYESKRTARKRVVTPNIISAHADAGLATVNPSYDELYHKVETLSGELAVYQELRLPLLAMIQFGGLVGRSEIVEQLGADDDPTLRLKILSVLGELIEEGTIRLSTAGYYTRERKK